MLPRGGHKIIFCVLTRANLVTLHTQMPSYAPAFRNGCYCAVKFNEVFLLILVQKQLHSNSVDVQTLTPARSIMKKKTFSYKNNQITIKVIARQVALSLYTVI